MAFEDQFPVKDITFRSKRFQGDWGVDEVTTTEGYFVPPVAVSTTLESVIKYLRSKKYDSNESKIMWAVINYLEEYRMLKVELRHKEEESVINEIDSTIETGTTYTTATVV